MPLQLKNYVKNDLKIGLFANNIGSTFFCLPHSSTSKQHYHNLKTPLLQTPYSWVTVCLFASFTDCSYRRLGFSLLYTPLNWLLTPKTLYHLTGLKNFLARLFLKTSWSPLLSTLTLTVAFRASTAVPEIKLPVPSKFNSLNSPPLRKIKNKKSRTFFNSSSSQLCNSSSSLQYLSDIARNFLASFLLSWVISASSNHNTKIYTMAPIALKYLTCVRQIDLQSMANRDRCFISEEIWEQTGSSLAHHARFKSRWRIWLH